jgi:hypothetical protein
VRWLECFTLNYPEEMPNSCTRTFLKELKAMIE